MCLVVILLLVVLQSAGVRSFALGKLTQYLATQRIDLQVDDLQYNLLRLSVDVRNLRVRSGETPDLPVFASIGQARLDLSLTDLLRGRYVVDSAVLQDVDLNYVVAADGRDNLPRTPANPSAPRQPIDLLVATASIPNAHLRYLNEGKQVEVALPLSDIEITGNAVSGRHQLRFESQAGQVRLRGHSDIVDHAAGMVELGEDDLRIDRLQLEALGSRATLAGAIRNFDAPQLALTLQSTLDAARSAGFAGLSDPIKGSIVAEATASGPLSAPIIDARLSAAALQIRALEPARVDARAAYDGASRRASVSSARIQGPWGRVAAEGNLALDRQDTSRLHAELTGVDVAAIMRGLSLSRTVDTRVDGKLDAEWPQLDYLEASGTGSATLTPTRTMRNGLPVAGRLLARATKGTIVADLQQISTAGAQAIGRVQVDANHDLQGQIHLSIADLRTATSAIEGFLGRAAGSLLPAPIDGAAIVDARLAGTVERPMADTSITASSLSTGSVRGIGIGATTIITRDALSITRAEANWNGAYASVAGTIELAGKQRLDLAIDAHAADLQQLLTKANAQQLPVTGAFVARGTVRGTVRRPLASATFSGTDIIAFGEQVGSLDAEASLVGREATLSRLIVDKPQPDMPGRLSATGSYDFDRESYTFDLQSTNVRLVDVTLPGGQRIHGAVQLSGKGAGTLSAPSGTVDLVVESLEIDRLRRETNAEPLSPQTAQLGRVVISATAVNHQATIKASAERFNLDANASIGLARPWQTTLVVRATDLELEKLPLGPEGSLTGRLRTTVNATGDLSDPAGAHATASIEMMTGSWNGQPFRASSERELRYGNQRLSIDHLEVTAGDSSLVVKGEVPLSAPGEAGNLDIDAHTNLAMLCQLLPADINVTGDGIVTLTGSVGGTPKSIVPNLLVTIEDGMLTSPQFPPGASNIQLRARMADGAVAIERLSSRWGNATFEASGTIPLEALPPLPDRSAAPRWAGSHQSRDPRPGPLDHSGRTCEACQVMSMWMSRSSAVRADLQALEGHVEFPRLEVALKRLTLTQQAPSRISIGPARPPWSAWHCPVRPVT